jgi:hypothetical protein
MHSTKQISDVDLVSDVLDAEREVERSKQRLRESLHDASETGALLVSRVEQRAKPVLLVAAAATVALAVGVAISAARGRRQRAWLAPATASLAGTLARGVGAWLLQAAARRLALELAARLETPASPALASDV